jgi:hypothetical protein
MFKTEEAATGRLRLGETEWGLQRVRMGLPATAVTLSREITVQARRFSLRRHLTLHLTGGIWYKVSRLKASSQKRV